MNAWQRLVLNVTRTTTSERNWVSREEAATMLANEHAATVAIVEGVKQQETHNFTRNDYFIHQRTCNEILAKLKERVGSLTIR